MMLQQCDTLTGTSGWHKFLEAERLDLIATSLNKATNAFQQTGLYPYNPNCKSWSGAIIHWDLTTIIT